MKSGLKRLFSLIIISEILLMACGSLETSYNDIASENSESSKKEMPGKEDIITAYINAVNKMRWLCVDGSDANNYDGIMKQDSLDGPINCKVYLSIEKGDTEENDIYNYDFIYELEDYNEGKYSSLRISYCPEFSCFTSSFSFGGPSSGTYEEVQKELEDIKADFLFETVIEFPKPFIPEITMTEKKEKILKTMRTKMKELSENIYGKGIYKVYIWDFSDADIETSVLIINKNKEIMSEFPICFYDEEGKEDIHVPLGVHVDTEARMDYAVGSIKYYELFEKFSVEVFECEVL